jgi:hypothetical protein
MDEVTNVEVINVTVAMNATSALVILASAKVAMIPVVAKVSICLRMELSCTFEHWRALMGFGVGGGDHCCAPRQGGRRWPAESSQAWGRS